MISPIGKRHLKSNSQEHAFTPLENKSLTGFTLIELVLVIFLVSILVGLSTPLFRRTFSGLQLKDAAFNISKTVNYAQEMAIIERANYKINFDFEKGRYWLNKIDRSGESPTYKRIEGRYGRTYFLPKGLKLGGTSKEFVLYPDGHSDTGEIKIADRGGDGYVVRIEGFAGRMKIEEIKK